MTVIQAKGIQHAEACVRCGTPSNGPYCPRHRPKNFDRAAPFWGGQHRTAQQASERQTFLAANPTCEYCGIAQATQVDHIKPQSRGGADDPSNWAAACGPCNLSKGADTSGPGWPE